MDTQNFDLSNCTRDGLRLVLSTAKDELRKYIRCCEEVKKAKETLEEEKGKGGDALIVILFIGTIVFFGLMVNAIITGKPIGTVIQFLLFFGAISVLFILANVGQKKINREVQSNILKYEAQLRDLEKKAEEALIDANAIWIIPRTYRDEYSLTIMLQYVENMEASNWERLTDLYRTHLHHKKMERQSRLQTEIAEATLNSTRRAEIANWAIAAGVWRR